MFKTAFCLFPLFLVLGCSEQQTFDTTFKLSMKQTFIGYCDSDDSDCHKKVNHEFDKCFEQGDDNTQELYQISKKFDVNQPKQSMNESELKTFIVFSKILEGCMIENIGGDYADNIKNGFEKNITITKPSLPPITKSGLLVAIKSNGDIWLNKDKIKMTDIKTMIKEHVNKNPDIHVIIMADKDSSTATFVSVMDQLKSAGIKNKSMSLHRN